MVKIETAYILAGGRSRRMGQDKLFLSLDGSTLLERVIYTCQQSFRLTKLVARDDSRFRKFDIPVLLDYPGVAGPLAGILAALRDCRESACFISAADLPDLDSETISDLVHQYEGEEFLGLKETEKLQPLCGIYSTALIDRLVKESKKPDYRIYEIIMTLNYRLIPVKKKIWRNINTPEDLVI